MCAVIILTTSDKSAEVLGEMEWGRDEVISAVVFCVFRIDHCWQVLVPISCTH